jgi:Ca2+/Na+ antiporter
MATTSGAVERQDTLYSPGLRKLTSLAGVGFAVFFVLSFVFSGDSSPGHSDPVGDWSAWAKDNEDNVRIAALMFALATYEFLLFLSVLRSYLGSAEEVSATITSGRFMVLAGGIVGISGLMLGIALFAASASHPDAPPEVIRAISDTGGAGFLLAAPGFAAMFISTFIVSKATNALPTWLTWLALATGIFFLLQLGTLLSDEYDNAFGAFYPLSFLGLLIFTIGASIFGYRRVSAETRGT